MNIEAKPLTTKRYNTFMDESIVLLLELASHEPSCTRDGMLIDLLKRAWCDGYVYAECTKKGASK